MWMRTLRLGTKNWSSIVTECNHGTFDWRLHSPLKGTKYELWWNENPASHSNAPVLEGQLEDKLIDSLQVRYDATKDVLNTSLFSLPGGFHVDIAWQRKMDLFLMRSIDHPAQFEKLRDHVTQRVAEYQSLIRPMTGNVKDYIKKMEEEYWFAQRVRQEFLQITHQPLLSMPRPLQW